MNKAQILAAIKMLACSQGFYSRLYAQVKDDKKYLDYLEQQNFGDTLDLIMFLEC